MDSTLVRMFVLGVWGRRARGPQCVVVRSNLIFMLRRVVCRLPWRLLRVCNGSGVYCAVGSRRGKFVYDIPVQSWKHHFNENIFHFHVVCGALKQLVKTSDFCLCAQFSAFSLRTSFVKFNSLISSLI